MRTHYENPLLRRAFTAHEALTEDEKERILAEKREESLMNERYELAAARRKGWKEGWKEGREEGREEKEKKVAALLLNDGMSPELVMKYTGILRGEVERLKKKSGPGNGGGKSVTVADKKDK